MSSPLILENVWLQQQKFEDAELLFRQTQSGANNNTGQKATHSLAQEIAQAGGGGDANVQQRLETLEKLNEQLRRETELLRHDINLIKNALKLTDAPPGSCAVPKPQESLISQPEKQAEVVDDEDDIDLFGSDDEEAVALKEKRIKEYAEKKAKKPVIIAKSSVILDVKPWDDETDMQEMEKRVRAIVKDGLLWGASKLLPVGYGINKLSIMCVVEDDKVSIEDLIERITEENEDLVQSVDVAAFNKI
ncbi:hypothetical protein BsWGS_24435 [Bradybaena similaris]